MENLQEPSLLDYARFHGIASDFTANNPLDSIDQTCEIPSETLSLPQDSLSAFNDYLSNIQNSVEQTLREEKLNVRKEGARFLSSVIRDAKAPEPEINWDDHLPDYNQIDDLKLELPIFSMDNETDVMLHKSPILYNQDDMGLLPLESSQSCPVDLLNGADNINETIKSEKLNCTKDSFKLLQNAIKCDDVSMKDLEDLLETTFPHKIDMIGPELSLLVPFDIDDRSYRSPSPAPRSHVLPSPVSSDFFEKPELQCCRSIPYNPGPELQSPEWIVKSSIPDTPDDGNMDKSRHQPSSSPSSETALGLVQIARTAMDEEKITPNITVQGKDPAVIISPNSSPPAHDASVSYSYPTDETEGQENYAYLAEQASQSLIQKQDSETLRTRGALSKSKDKLQGKGNIAVNETLQENVSYDAEYVMEQDRKTAEYSEEYMLAPETKDGKEVSREPSSTSEDNMALCIVAQLQTEPTFSAYKHPPQRTGKRERVKERPSKEFEVSQRNIESVLETKPHSSSLPSFTALGSLSTFMETRSRPTKRQIMAKSPYFNDKSSGPFVRQPSPILNPENARMPEEKQRTPGKQISNVEPKLAEQKVPQYHKRSREQPLVFLSTALLKSHLRIVRYLEGMEDQLTIIYRDYDHDTPNEKLKSPANNTSSQLSNNHRLQSEADIIISPTTGIILTTSQATTQLYLPGHKPSHPQMNGIKCINSPLRERIFLVASRYERMYVFICHGVNSLKEKSQSKLSGPTADKRVLACITSLTAFCTSMSAYATILPTLMPSCPETVAGWILSLAHKHSFSLPVRIPHSIAFTPVNPSNKTELDSTCMEIPTCWEIFLRRIGLNPYAAQVVLAVLKREGQELAYGSLGDDSDFMPGLPEKRTGAIARFVEMTPEQHGLLFGELIGDRMLGRIGAIIDKDWQCDWALNFDADAEL